MTETEFRIWLGKHGTIFPAFRREIEELGETRPETLSAWASVLAPVRLEHAIEASKRLFVSETHPRWDRHVSAVYRLAGELAGRGGPARSHSASTDCAICYGSGWVTIFAVGQTLERLIRHRRRESRWIPEEANIDVRCSCATGATLTGRHAQYDPKRDRLYPGPRQRTEPRDPDLWAIREEQVTRALNALAYVE